MKTVVTLIMLSAIWLNVMAQAPQKMSYQAVVRNTDGELVKDHAVGMKVSILQGSLTGTVVFQELYNPNPQTNANGLVSIEIGTGIPLTGTFSGIDWSAVPFYLKTETDPAGGTNYTITGTSQLLSVPYALYAETVKDAATKTYVDALISQLSKVVAIVADGDGNIYPTIKIGSQIWMAENLKTRRYNDGTAIPQVIDGTAWANLTIPGYCWYNNDRATYGNIYGALYNWYTVNTKKLCPTGWHVPSDVEWTAFTTFLGGEALAGGKLKSKTGWDSPNTGATNESGFSGLPAGYRFSNGTFYNVGSSSYWWSSTEGSAADAWGRDLGYDYSYAGRFNLSKKNGFSIRCIRDCENCGTITDIEGNVYSTIQIGTQLWMSENLKTTKYNDGIAIPLVTDAWANMKTPGYCWYNNDKATYENICGALYNWYTVNTGKLCPTGWHVPSDAEWTTLTDYLGGATVAGGKMKETGTTHWASPNTGATNESGFSGLPGGLRNYAGIFNYIGYDGYWWSSTEYSSSAWSWSLRYWDVGVHRSNPDKEFGFCIRCVRD